MATVLSTSQVNRLGERLAKSDVPSADDLRELAGFQELHIEPMSAVGAAVQATARAMQIEGQGFAGFQVTQRLKTSNTLIDKLRRGTRLTRMQDIGGVRLVAVMPLWRQDECVARLTRALPITDTVDRRRAPTHGYRAVHLVVNIDGRNIEVQIRTSIQQTWADVTEALADIWGRQIRYGGAPAGPDELTTAQRIRAFSIWVNAAGIWGEWERVMSNTLFELWHTPASDWSKLMRVRQRAITIWHNRLVRAVAETGLPEVVNAVSEALNRNKPTNFTRTKP